MLERLNMIIVLLPLTASLLVGVLGRRLGTRLSSIVAVSSIGIACVLSLWVLKALMYDGEPALRWTAYVWGITRGVSFDIGFWVDRLTALLMCVVLFVSWMVHIYTIGYMRGDPGYHRFFSYITFFTFAMLMLVMANNFLQLFFGWEAVGMVSYLLIGFWFKRERAISASLKAFLVNRVGDLGFLIGIAAIFHYFGTLEYAPVFSSVKAVVAQEGTGAITFICLCLLIGAMGKSAQIPLHVWLPDSMEGPTPISALIHAATMVTAGVFMIARLSPLFELSETVLNLILIMGATTAVMMGLVGIVQNDIKRIIAYSTLSQLGYMMAALGASAYSLGIFHLVTHAFFKALLFLGAGSVILACHHEQDIWKMDGVWRRLPISYGTMLVGSVSLAGIPFFSGFYSKDLIIEAVQNSQLPGTGFASYALLAGVLITALYTFRLFFAVFHGPSRTPHKQVPLLEEDHTALLEGGHLAHKERLDQVYSSPWVIWLPLVCLAVPSLMIGGILVAPIQQGILGDGLSVHLEGGVRALREAEIAGQGGLARGGAVWWSLAWHALGQAPFWLSVIGIGIAWLCYFRVPALSSKIKSILHRPYRILEKKYGFDEVIQWLFVGGARCLGWICWRVGDRWLIDGVGVNGTAHIVDRLASMLRRLQTGYLYHYAFAMVTGFLILMGWLMISSRGAI